MKKFKRIIKIMVILSPIICFLLIWGVSLAKCEILTLMHGNEFSEAYEAYKENTMLGDMEYWKVLDYSKTNSRVYFVSKDQSMGNILSFVKENNEWKYDKWEDCAWSTSGTADDVVWPYWWHFFYSHPRLES